MKSFLRFALILLCLEGMDTFQFQPQKPSPTVKESQHESVNCRRTFVSSFGLVAASVVLGKPKDANAFSTSLTLADDVKTLDFSLPSYDSISSSKASVETVEGLAQEYKEEKTPRAPKAKKAPKADGDNGNPMASLLPSMNKGPANKPKAKSATTSKPPPRQKEEKAPIIETMDMTLPSYESTSKTKSVFSI